MISWICIQQTQAFKTSSGVTRWSIYGNGKLCLGYALLRLMKSTHIHYFLLSFSPYHISKPFRVHHDTNQVRSEFCLEMPTDLFYEIRHIFQTVYRIKLRFYKEILDTWKRIVVKFHSIRVMQPYYLNYLKLMLLLWQIHRQSVLS